MFHQYLSGEIPGFDREKYDYAFEAVLDGCELIINPAIPTEFRALLKQMLDREPDKRPDVEEIFAYLTNAPRVSEEEKTAINSSSKGFFSKARTAL